MPRFTALSLCVCLALPLFAGCQTAASHRTARVERSRPATFWTANGEKSGTRLVSERKGATPTRLASRSTRDGGASLGGLLSRGSRERIPLPRTAVRDIDAAPGSADEPIGAF